MRLRISIDGDGASGRCVVYLLRLKRGYSRVTARTEHKDCHCVRVSEELRAM
jgi:hypothetical protein